VHVELCQLGHPQWVGAGHVKRCCDEVQHLQQDSGSNAWCAGTKLVDMSCSS
jgi:hypothetical protein